MDYKEQYQELTDLLEDALPIKASPIRELVQIFRKKGHPITLKSELTITDVFNSGDMSGIMCTVHNDNDEVMACSLSHLIFSRKEPLYNKIADYQKKRAKRVKKLNKM